MLLFSWEQWKDLLSDALRKDLTCHFGCLGRSCQFSRWGVSSHLLSGERHMKTIMQIMHTCASTLQFKMLNHFKHEYNLCILYLHCTCCWLFHVPSSLFPCKFIQRLGVLWCAARCNQTSKNINEEAWARAFASGQVKSEHVQKPKVLRRINQRQRPLVPLFLHLQEVFSPLALLPTSKESSCHGLGGS